MSCLRTHHMLLFMGGKICYYNKELTNIGRLGSILYAGDFNLNSNNLEELE